MSIAEIVIPSAIAGTFGIATALIAARLASASERRKSERDLHLQQKSWQRDFAARYADAVAANKPLAEALRQQFAGAFLYIGNSQMATSDRRFIPVGARMTIGRANDCDITLPCFDSSVSRKHALIEIDGADVRLTDLASANGTFVDDTRIDGSVVARDGAQLRFGTVEARLVRLD